MVNYACAFSQSELGKHFEWTITDITIKSCKRHQGSTEQTEIKGQS